MSLEIKLAKIYVSLVIFLFTILAIVIHSSTSYPPLREAYLTVVLVSFLCLVAVHCVSEKGEEKKEGKKEED